jgi:RNA polymerase sigma-70 factor, ECF subfamily
MILRHVAGLAPGEIAVVLDKSESSVHGLHHRARSAVKDALRDLGAAPVTAAA